MSWGSATVLAKERPDSPRLYQQSPHWDTGWEVTFLPSYYSTLSRASVAALQHNMWCRSPVAGNGLLWMEQDCSSQVQEKGLPTTPAIFCISKLPGAGFLNSEIWVVP